VRRYASAVVTYCRHVSVCLSVGQCICHTPVLYQNCMLNVGSRKQRRTIAQRF